ncbi:hypothetical protein J6590_041712 [Homalodisca vitripennis]|nr:hypothetical protein J6590_041712 [Homalodisca vitripennis]
MNPEKTKYICIQTKQMKISKNFWTPSLFIGDTEVDISESSELLGVVFDDGMDWGRQLGKVAGKLSKAKRCVHDETLSQWLLSGGYCNLVVTQITSCR